MRNKFSRIWIIIFFNYTLFGNSVTAQPVKNSQIGVYSGYHFFSSGDPYSLEFDDLLNKNFLRIQKTDYFSASSIPASGKLRTGSLLFSAEIRFQFKPIADSKFFNYISDHFLLGTEIGWYAFNTTNFYSYKGNVAFTDNSETDTNLQNRTFSISIDSYDKFHNIFHIFNIYYQYSEGIALPHGFKILPYAVIQAGYGLLSMKRHTTISSESLSLTSFSANYAFSFSGEITESTVNEAGFHFGILIGGEMEIFPDQKILLRAGFQRQTYSILMDRNGFFRETRQNIASKTNIIDPSTQFKTYNIIREGVTINLGYSYTFLKSAKR